MAKRSASAIVNDPSFWESGDDESIDRDSDVEDADFIIPIDENSSDSDNDSTADFDSSTSRPGSKPDGHDDVNFAVGILTENASENEIDETEYEVEVNRVIDGLIGGRTYTSRQGRPSTGPVVNPDSRLNRELDHSPFKFDSQSKCTVHINRVDTTFGCSVCKVRMCPHPCFHRYHYMAHYKFDDPAKKRKVTEE
ncbi:hypothetical protein LOTGIDRAFT_176644 [Lottia gigantea]|uniref:Uncharacterized protein n=1 Tax=Lottia gigantea TaxID=225164 RepID=V3ZWP9_LOTGI|nr:hypothetical protein LOTGIDRAFT_176644 [Lottia gigantea]ESO95933.1 hypothetical protein LOTGIDRAFT_176644 [Lottia gigantea]